MANGNLIGIERIDRIYSIGKRNDGKFIVFDCIGMTYNKPYESREDALAYIQHIRAAEAAQMRELRGWDGK